MNFNSDLDTLEAGQQSSGHPRSSNASQKLNDLLTAPNCAIELAHEGNLNLFLFVPEVVHMDLCQYTRHRTDGREYDMRLDTQLGQHQQHCNQCRKTQLFLASVKPSAAKGGIEHCINVPLSYRWSALRASYSGVSQPCWTISLQSGPAPRTPVGG